MKKNAFTLIELLAVIVILAIIALIAVPTLINIINDSKFESQKRSIDYYAEALKDSLAEYQIKNNTKVGGKFTTTDGKMLTRDNVILNVNYKGNVVCNRIIINKNGSIYLSECTVDGNKVYINQEETNKENPTYYEYGRTEYGMIMEREDKTYGWYFFDMEIPSCFITKFTIHNELDIPNKEEYESRDFSYNQDGSVILYWKVDYEQNDIKYYEMHLASDGEMYAPYDSTYLFAYVGCQIENFKFDLSNLNTSKTTNMSHMLEGAASNARPSDINIGGKFDTSNVTDMSYMFKDAFKMPQDDNGYWYSAKFKLPDSFNTSKVTNMSHMFDGGFYNARLLDLGNNFDTSNVTDMSYMFATTFYMGSLKLGEKFDTSNVINMSYMFYGTGSHHMEQLDLGRKFYIGNNTNIAGIFYNCGNSNSLTKVIVHNNEIKTKIKALNFPNDIPQFWLDNNIVEVQNN